MDTKEAVGLLAFLSYLCEGICASGTPYCKIISMLYLCKFREMISFLLVLQIGRLSCKDRLYGLRCEPPIGAQHKNSLVMGQGGQKDSSGVNLHIKFDVNLIPLIPSSIFHKFNSFILKKKN